MRSLGLASRMRLVLVLALAILLSLPVAAADQDIAVGPASVTTLNETGGDGCVEGGNGYDLQRAQVRVDVTEHESIVAQYQYFCSAYAYDYGGGQYANGYNENGGLYVHRVTDGNYGAGVSAYYQDARQDASWGQYHGCSSGADVLGGIGVTLGCFPNGGRWPTLPPLP